MSTRNADSAVVALQASGAPMVQPSNSGSSIGDIAGVVTLVIGIPAAVVALITLINCWREGSRDRASK